MTSTKKYVTTFEFEAADANEAAQKVMQSFYLGEIDASAVTIGETQKDGNVFNYPYTRLLIEGLNEKGEN